MACFFTPRLPTLRLPVLRRRREKVLPEALFRMTLTGQENRPSGLHLVGHESYSGLVVADIGCSQGIRQWNLEHPAESLEIGHVIVEVNGVTDQSEIIQKLRSPQEELSILVNKCPTKVQRHVIQYLLKKRQLAEQLDVLLEEVPPSTEEIEMCAICHEEMGAVDPGHALAEHAGHACSLARLPCGHEFHKVCVKKWLVEGRLRCPLCNHSLKEAWA